MWALACSGLFALVVLLVLGPMADPRPEAGPVGTFQVESIVSQSL